MPEAVRRTGVFQHGKPYRQPYRSRIRPGWRRAASRRG